jgi:hypothetical protein
MPTRLTPLRALTLAVLALGMTLRAEDPAVPKKKIAAESPKVQPAPKAVSPKVVFSTTISETLATNLTIAPGANQFLYAKSDFTGVETLYVSFYGASTQDFSKTNYVSWWAIPNNTQYSAAQFWAGSSFAYLNTGSILLNPWGNQLAIDFQNNGTSPVTYTQVTIWANAR